MEIKRTVYIMLDDDNWIKEYSIKRRKDLIAISDYPEDLTNNPLSYRMEILDNIPWYEFVYEPKVLSSED